MIFRQNLAVGSVCCVNFIKEIRKAWNMYITWKEKYDAMIEVTRSKSLRIQYLSTLICRQTAGTACTIYTILLW